ncbi:uncharacterized protein LOC142986324 [Anticarsia gemmatalis]|uniref:uncharacterized protein LOC142986324 n=1 Tax=Anticarsia gemmatalis TaxID=129554 RepID=UPI003F7718D7
MANPETVVIGEFSNTQYVLPLDSLDMCFLNRFIDKPHDQRKLLWSRGDLDGTHYVRVTVTEDIRHEEPCLEPLENYLCHVCNVNVPKDYKRIHMYSEIHQMYQRLYDIMFRNISEILHTSVLISEAPPNYEVFYCEPCSKVIARDKQGRHNSSRYHWNSVQRQKIAEKFFAMYTRNADDDDTDYFASDSSSADQDLKCDESNNSHTNVSDAGGENESEMKIVPYKPKEETIDAVPSTSKNNTVTVDKRDEVIKYFKKIIAMYELRFEMPTIEDENIIVTTPKGHTEKIPFNTFHGLIQNQKYEDTRYCQLCNKWVIQDNVTHIECMKHVNNIIQPIDDHFCRKLTSKKVWSHCLLCNDLVLIGSDHIIDAEHEKYYEQVVEEPPEKEEDTKQKTFCNVCRRDIHTHNYLDHINSKKHKAKLELLEPDKKIRKQVNEKAMICELCQVSVAQYGRVAHENSKRHKNKLRWA